jgi:hypothetical protein
MSTATLYRLVDAARSALSVLVGVLTYLAGASDVLHLPAGVTGAIATALTLASHYGIRAYVTPHPPNSTGGRSIGE